MRPSLLAALLALAAPPPAPADEPPLLLQCPALADRRVAFAYAGDLWIVPREGGDAVRLTSGVGLETMPHFSPDGELVAFTGEYEGNLDVYVVPADGGQPTRLTHHPDPDIAVGWTPDGENILFRSGRQSYSRFDRLFTVPRDGGLPEALPLPMAEQGSYSPDGDRIAYVPFWNRRAVPDSYIAWKRYRGGKASPIWIARLSDSHVEKVPRDDSNDFNPLWVGDTVYFLSDREGTVGLFAFDAGSKDVRRVFLDEGRDLLSASAGPGGIVVEQLGRLRLVDPKTGDAKDLAVRVAADLPNTRPRFEKVAEQVRAASPSPTGKRVAFGARGEILTLPAEKGDPRNLTNSPGVAERYPAWSPDGTRIAFFSDESGEYALHVVAQDGTGEIKTINLGSPPSFFYNPAWSPDSKKIAYTDKRLNLWYVDLDGGDRVKVDTDTYDAPERSLDPAWSPDSRFLAYTKRLESHLHAVFVHDLGEGRSHQLTDGLSDARYPAFDKGGKSLYFTASTDVGPTTGWLDMSSMNQPTTRSAYLVVLRSGEPSPLAPESDEEAAKDGGKEDEKKDADEDEDEDKDKEGEGKKDDKDKAGPEVRIDYDGIDQRIVALPVPPRDYAGLVAGKAGVIYLAEQPPTPFGALVGREEAPALIVTRFTLKDRKPEPFLDGVSAFELTADGEKALYRKGDSWFLAGAGSAPKAGDGKLATESLEVRVDPRAEWRQMYREVWRIERDFLYDPGAHGLDLEAAEAEYEPYLAGVGSRADLNYLFNDMLGELVLGHTYVAGGDSPEVERVKGGLLGCDYAIEDGKYKIVKIYRGENWNPALRAPLTAPGVEVEEGDFLLAVNGRDLSPPATPEALLENTAGTTVVLKVGPKADGSDARDAKVVPIASETSLRNRAWIDGNRRKVDELSKGKVAYVYLPDTGLGGFTSFNRYFFAQVDRQGAVIDERFNGGGSVADYIVEYLDRPLMSLWATREGKSFPTPVGSIFGPKAMLINEFAGSGGDALPWMFRKAKVGPLIGTRTWGGLVGIYDYPDLIDGGIVTAPRLAFWNPEAGAWEVENRGVAPDIEVDLDPEAVREGHDPQLEAAVEAVLQAIAKDPPPTYERPEYPRYHRGGVGAGSP
jgi:tricorn protease